MLNPAFPHRACPEPWRRAFYDDQGDIILPGLPLSEETHETREGVSAQQEDTRASPIIPEQTVEWIITEEEPEELHELEADEGASAAAVAEPPLGLPARVHVREHIVAVRRVTRDAVREGAHQYYVSIVAGKPLLGRAADDLQRLWHAIWNFLSQPVWVPTRKREIREYKRGTLFLLDILRFGGTFTVIFLGLFVALNYDSFWQITKSQVHTVLQSPVIETPETSTNSHVIDALKATAAQTAEGRGRGELMSYLPTVGPPDNRILIPRLNLNVPLVSPPITSLLRQDWTAVETDIQDSLQYGVIHYPGTARPGQAGNFFVTGHSSYYPWAPGKYKTVFARLSELNPGDEYWVYYKGDKHRYIVTAKKEVMPADITVLDQPEDQRIATLMTCTPVGTTLRRLVVIAQEVDPATGIPLKVGERSEKGVTPRPKLEALPI